MTPQNNQQLTELQNRVLALESLLAQLTQQTNITDLNGFFGTSTTAAETTARKAYMPLDISQQLFIDTSTGTKKLYVYDIVGNVWRSCTIS